MTSSMAALVFPVLGLGAGVLTTLAGQGGGLFLLLACAAMLGPREALAVTAPALLLGNLHRATLLRQHIVWPTALRMIAGALPGGLVGGMLAGSVPSWMLRTLLVLMVALAIAKALGLLRFTVPKRAFVPAGFVIGVVTGTAGGAGVIFAPVLLASGLSGNAYVATSAAIAFTTHVGRVTGYASLGMFHASLVLPTVAIAAAIFLGNWAASRMRDRFGAVARATPVLEYAVLLVCVVLSVAGLG